MFAAFGGEKKREKTGPPCRGGSPGDFNWGFGTGLLSSAPWERLPPAALGRGRNGFPWEHTGAPRGQGSEARRILLKGKKKKGKSEGSWSAVAAVEDLVVSE